VLVVVCDGVLVGVTVGEGVIVGVTVVDGVGGMITKQSGQSGSNKEYFDFNNLKLCLTSDASSGSTYIRKALISPIKLPPKISSKNILVVRPE